MCADV
jgi:nuclear pore complex protein Nup160